MKKLHLFLLILAHLVFWLIFARHVPFFIKPLSFLDFDTYLRLWRAVFSGVNPYSVSYMTTLGPPLVLLPYLPFVFFPLVWAQFFFFMLNVASGYIACFLLAGKYMPRSIQAGLSLSLILFLAFPTRFGLLMGQPGLIVMLGVTLLVIGKRWQKVALWFLIISKTFFGLTLFALVRKQKARLIVIVLGLMAVVIALLPWLRFSTYVYFIRHSFSTTLTQSSPSTTIDYYNQSLKATLQRLGLENIYLAVFILSLFFLIFKIIKTQNVVLALVASIFLSPVVWQHYLFFFFQSVFGPF